MLFTVVSGELETFVRAAGAKEAAVKSARNFRGELSPLMMVNEGRDNLEINDQSVFFLSDSILEECSMKLVS